MRQMDAEPALPLLAIEELGGIRFSRIGPLGRLVDDLYHRNARLSSGFPEE
jgi:hypothetical protein